MANKTDKNELVPPTTKDLSLEDKRDMLVRSFAISDLDPNHVLPEAYDKIISGNKKPASKGGVTGTHGASRLHPRL